MTLDAYKQKRSFKNTPEPTGGKTDNTSLEFVIQKHKASHLHYDFRLEVRGVLKSWAVPKGPSLDPSVKRLAMLVEDHPFDYKDFEGIIPEGNYGAGTVIIWDRGTFEPAVSQPDKKSQEKQLLKEFFSGKMHLVLNGEKLKGKFDLIKVAARGETAWLLSKVKDKYAAKSDVIKRDKSVVSSKTIESMTENPSAEWKSNRKTKSDKQASASIDIRSIGKKTPFPKVVYPMLCTLTKEPIDDTGYIHEIKWDGFRIISYVNGATVRMDSRSAKDYTQRYPLIVDALKKLKRKVVLDGEVVVFNDKGMPDFDALQSYNGHSTPVSYCVFDILWIDGYNIKDLPLVQRKEILKELVGENEVLKYSDSFDDGPALYKQSINFNLEGIVSKEKNSPYIEGERANKWLKTPTRIRQEFVIGGWAESDKARSFRSLLFGAYNKKGELEWIGRSGGGYKEKEMPAILKKLKSIERKQSPFVNDVLDTKGAMIHYVKPELVANFEFATWTKSGRIRKPATFLGFRKDKNASQVVREVPKPVEVIEDQIHEDDKPPKKRTVKDSNWKIIEARKPRSETTFDIDSCTIPITDIEREIWKDIPKAKLIEYYHNVSRLILPHLKGRPLSLHVKPDRATAPGFYIKDMEGRQPDCAEIFSDERRHPKAGKRNQIDYLVCNNEATLLYMINLGCIDINPWMSRTTDPLHPDFINIDLDPSDDDFKKVIDSALAAKEVLAKLKLKSFIKTSGKTGMHIYIPVSGLTHAQARHYSEQIGEAIHKLVPKISTTEVSISSRGTKLFIDPSQNDYADTLASVYSVRPHKIPTVSTPLEWREIKHGLAPDIFTMQKILERIRKKGDLFEAVLNPMVADKNTMIINKSFES